MHFSLVLVGLASFHLLCASASAAAHPHFVDGVHQRHADDALCAELTRPLLPANRNLAYEQTEDDERLQTYLSGLQHRCNAKHSRILLYQLHSDCGFGAELHWITVALTAAVETNRTLVIREDVAWQYADAAAGFCAPGHTFSCYFASLSSCVVRSRADLDEILAGVPLAEVPIFTTKELHALDAHRVVQYSTDLQKQLDFPFFRSVPSGWKSDRDVFWWRSQLVKFTMRLSSRVAGIVDARRDALGLRSVNALGIHSRRGDKLFGSAINNPETKGIPMALMFDVSEAVAVACGYDAVFVATKDGDFVDYVDARVAQGADRVRWLIERSVSRKERGWSTHDLMRGLLNRTEEALDVISDTFLLASVSCFVGAFDSNLSRLAAELGEALRSFDRPPLSFNGTSWIVFP
jgi:hypothetical protein